MQSLKFDVEFSVSERGRKSPQYTIDSDLSGEVSLAEFLEFTRANLIVIADQVLREEQEKGFDKNPIVAVDGRVGKPVSRVSPLGQIEFTARANIGEILVDTMQAIIDRSPVDTGQYIRSHVVLHNGRQVANDIASLKSWIATNPQIGENDLIRFVNTQPYARKLERLGVTASRQQARRVASADKRGRSGIGGRILAPNGAYFLSTRAIRRKYKRNSSIKFGFISGSQLGLSAGFKTGTSGARGGGSTRLNKPGRPYLYPTITINVSERGTL